ncbi:MAG: hypothetical protein IKL02_03995 [Kiritimatiellae bacterium]|nr:hypothetical protein [Kiritimatiellia bacterium]MBR3776745.1 hypothetical protein [Kiritimatiellia bacterium]
MKAAVLALTIPLQPLVSENVLEPSVRNEVDHALSRAPQAERVEVIVASNSVVSVVSSTNVIGKILYHSSGDVFGTNGLSATDIAIKLVSSQKSDGRWTLGTNDVTSLAVDILKSL